MLPATAPKRTERSGELYIPNTSASASFVARVTVGSNALRVVRVRPVPAPGPSLKLTRADAASGGNLKSDYPAYGQRYVYV